MSIGVPKKFVYAVAAAYFSGVLPVQAQKGPPLAVPVVTANAEERMMAPTVWVPGTVISRDEAVLAAEVAGRLIWTAEVGQRMQIGEVVARLDDALISAEVSEAEASIRRENARLAYQNDELTRLKGLAAGDVIAKSQVDKIRSDQAVAKAELEAAVARLELNNQRLARHVIKAPFAGVVAERLHQSGEWAGSGEAVLRLADDRTLEIQAQVTGASVAYLKIGQRIDLLRGETPLHGRLSAIVSVGDVHSHLYEIRVAVNGSGWRAGQAVRVAAPSDAARRVLAVPRDALVLRRAGITLFRVKDDDTAERVEVMTGVASGDLIEVTGGVTAGDRVVVRGGERLRPGQAVQVVGGGAGS